MKLSNSVLHVAQSAMYGKAVDEMLGRFQLGQPVSAEAFAELAPAIVRLGAEEAATAAIAGSDDDPAAAAAPVDSSGAVY